ncbi:MAG: NAD(P)H-quinone oxidoreductase [Betaproteobacteria bacterium]|nr:NAD(P)H-quinone oxidoreductase [Betaproteobacteria bacterium]
MSIPSTMRHTDHGTGGGPEAIRITHGPVPQPGPGQVLVRVAYAGVNRPDVAQRSGSYPPPKDASPILGLEVAGEVIALGEGAQRWKLGDQVCALVHGGGYAEVVAVHATHCLPIPAGWSLKDAASLPETYFTVWVNVFDTGHLSAGESILIHGGSSGIGSTAIQLAKAFGCTVYTTVGSADKAAFCRNLGADHVINYREADFHAEVKRLAAPKGVNLVLDYIGGDYLKKNVDLLGMDGRLIQLAFMQGREAMLDLGPILMRRIVITGSALRPRTTDQKAAIARGLEAQVWPLFAAGKLRSVVNAEFTLDQVAEAHRLMESSAHLGKIVLRIA